MSDYPATTELKVSTGKDWKEGGGMKFQGVPCWCCQPWAANLHPGPPAKAMVGCGWRCPVPATKAKHLRSYGECSGQAPKHASTALDLHHSLCSSSKGCWKLSFRCICYGRLMQSMIYQPALKRDSPFVLYFLWIIPILCCYLRLILQTNRKIPTQTT